jgi:hypothetical protein
MYLARVKLQHDLYDRRYAVFQAVRRFLDEAVSERIVSGETFRAFALGTADAAFLFNDQLAGYLKEMRDHAAAAQSTYTVIEAVPDMPHDQRAAASKAAGEHFSWVINQIDGLSERFRPFLTLDKRSRAPLRLRWRR